MNRVLYSALFSAAIFLAAVGFAWADSGDAPAAKKAGKSVQGELTFVLATKNPANMDKRLEHMANDLRRAFAGRFRNFRLHKDWKPILKPGETKKFPLPGGGEMKMSLRGSDGPYLRLHLDMPDWNGIVRVRNGKRFFHAGRKHGEDTLIVGLMLSASAQQ